MNIKRYGIKLGIWAVVAGVSAYSMFVAFSVFAQENDEVTLTGENVVQYDWSHRFPIENGSREINHGEKVGDWCRFTTHLERAPGESPKILRTLAADYEECVELVEVGVLSTTGQEVIAEEIVGGPGLEEEPGQAITDEGAQNVPSSRGPGLNRPLFFPSATASFLTRYEDPVGADVNWARSTVVWQYDEPNNMVYPTDHECDEDHLELTGWYISVPMSCTSDNFSGGHSGSISYEKTSARIHFRNYSFPCIPIGSLGFIVRGASTHYEDNWVKGTSNGGSQGGSYTWTSGLCDWLLHKETVLN